MTDDNGAVIGEAELVWTDIKAAYIPNNRKEDINIFKTNGWHIIDEEENFNLSIFGVEINE